MGRGEKVTLLKGPFFGYPVYATVKRSSDGDWTHNKAKIGWLAYIRSPMSGKCRIHWFRIGEYVWMLALGRPAPLPAPPPSCQDSGKD